MTYRGDAEFLQIIGGQFLQQFWPDVVFCKCGRVLLQPQPPKPRRNVHVGPPKSSRLGVPEFNLPERGPQRVTHLSLVAKDAGRQLRRSARYSNDLKVRFRRIVDGPGRR